MTAPHPAVDLVTENAAIIMQKRPLVPLSSWIADAIGAVSEAGLPLQIVTSHDARLTMPMHSLLQPPYLRWVVGHPDGFYDGLTGERLDFDGSWFVADASAEPRGLAAPFAATPDGADGTRLVIGFRVRHPALEATALGAATGACYRAFTGAGPSGWGTSEPVARPWSPDDITALSRGRSPHGTRFCHTGLGPRRAIGTTEVGRHSEGVDESVLVHVGYEAGEEPPVHEVTVFAEELAGEHHLIDLQAQTRPGRPDLTEVPNRTGPPAPIGMALGPATVREIGLERALTFPGGMAQRLGAGRFPAVWYPVGDGGMSEAWSILDRLIDHLNPPAEMSRAPSRSAETSPVEPLKEGIWRRNPP